MNLLEIIQQRRSIRAYLDKSIKRQSCIIFWNVPDWSPLGRTFNDGDSLWLRIKNCGLQLAFVEGNPGRKAIVQLQLVSCFVHFRMNLRYGKKKIL